MVTKSDSPTRRDSGSKSHVDDYEVAVILAQTSAMIDGKYKTPDASSDDVAVSESDYGSADSVISSPTPSECGSDTSSSDSCCGTTRKSRRKRARTAFSSEQVYKLEKKFQDHKYLSPTEREDFAEKIGLSDIQIKTWFQNRRMKWKRQRKDDSEDAAIPESYPVTSLVSSAYPPPLIPSPPSLYPAPMTSAHLRHVPSAVPLPARQMVPLSPYPPRVSTLAYPTLTPMRSPYAPAIPFHPPASYSLSPLVSSPYSPLHRQYPLTFYC